MVKEVHLYPGGTPTPSPRYDISARGADAMAGAKLLQEGHLARQLNVYLAGLVMSQDSRILYHAIGLTPLIPSQVLWLGTCIYKHR